MKKGLIKLLLLSIVFGLASLIHPLEAFAQSSTMDCGFRIECVDPTGEGCKLTSGTNQLSTNTKAANLFFELSTIPDSEWDNLPSDILSYEFYAHINGVICKNISYTGKLTKTSQIKEYRGPGDQDNCQAFATINNTFHLKYKNPSQGWVDLCKGDYTVNSPSYTARIDIVPVNGAIKPGLYDVDSIWEVTITEADVAFSTYLDDELLNNGSSKVLDMGNLAYLVPVANRPEDQPVEFTLNKFPPGTHTVQLRVGGSSEVIKTQTFTVLGKGSPTPEPTLTPTNTPPPPPPGAPTYTPVPPVPSLAPICEQIDSQYQSKCKDCVDNGRGIWTAIGCLPTDMEAILKDYVFVYGTGITGGIAFLYFIYGVFLILTSGGNPEKIAEGKEIIISALSGLFLIIFSVFLLRVIGYDILKIPGFG